MEITEKVAYLKGLAEGMELDTEKKEGKLLAPSSMCWTTWLWRSRI